MKKSINVSLSIRSIDAAIQTLQDEKKRITQKTLELIEAMCKEGEDFAINALGHIDRGDTINSITGYRQGNKGIVQAGGHAIWIEFGTGAKGLDNDHPSGEYLNAVDWQYCTGETIFFTEDGRVGWYYPADDGTYRFTEGLASQHFMFDTARHLEQIFKSKAKEVFK